MVNIKVAVRIRPFSQREVNQKDESIVETCEKSILVTNLKVPETPNGDSRQRIRRFAVDYCYDPKQPETCTQESVYQDVGKEILESMFNGYNACVLAYGHSASGKTYTMMGHEDDPGLTPRICQGLFQRMREKAIENPRIRYHTVISFLEIYNERVRDLLVSDDSGANFSLRVREHPKLGPYVQDLSQHIVNDEESILEYLSIGNSRRSTAATENNIHSSRSHAVFTIRFKQSEEGNFQTELSSKVHLVDLAGSLQDGSQTQVKKKTERAGSTQSKTRLKEGANINKSLVTLGNVISALAESCETFVHSREQPVTKTWQPFVPYRDSVLTWLLKDTLGGNSNTIMIATVSPGSSCLNETINTLRYAKRTKRIVNQPIVNEDPKIRTIRELREEIEKLRNIIFNLQTNKRNGLNDIELSSDCMQEEDEIVNVSENKSLYGIKKLNCKEDNEDIIIRNIENDAISGLDILPDLSTANDENNSENHNFNHHRRIITSNANSFTVDVSKINDEKKTDVNGTVIDKLTHESQVFSDSLESFSFVSEKQTNPSDINDFIQCNTIGHGDSNTRKRKSNQRIHKDNQSLGKISRISKLKISSKRQLNDKIKFYLKREWNSLENLNLSKMLHRSRPDLIKGISSHSKDGLPSTSSQSFTDVSGLSQSTSENSLNSSGSIDSQFSENKIMKCWSEKSKIEERTRMKIEETMHKSNSRQSSIGDGSGSSTPTQIPKPVTKRRADKRSEIVAAVTTRLYATKKKPDARLEALQANEKEDDNDGELEELKLCKRARMKLFDLSRKLAMAKRIKKTIDSDTQTDFGNGTIRVKEKSVVTDQSGIVQYENSATNTSNVSFKNDKEHSIIMNQVFIPRFSNYVVECGKNVRVEIPMKPTKNESGTQTITVYKNQCTSPSEPNQKEENFSDDSLENEEFDKLKNDSELDSLEINPKPIIFKSTIKSQSNENITKSSNMKESINRRSYDSLLDARMDRITNRSWLPITRYPIAGTNALYEYDPNKSFIYNNDEENWKISNDITHESNEEPPENKIRKTEIILPMFNGLAICTETNSNSENITEDTINFINQFLSGNDEIASSENSLVSNDESDITSSSETSSEDFIFIEGPKQKEGLNRKFGLGNLYTISENSEFSDVTISDPTSPQSSQQSSLQILKDDKTFQSSMRNKKSEDDDRLSNDKEYAMNIIQNPFLIESKFQEKIKKSNNYNKKIENYFQDGFNSNTDDNDDHVIENNSKCDRENSFCTIESDIPINKMGNNFNEKIEEDNPCEMKRMNSGLHETISNGQRNKEGDGKKQQKKIEKIKKINWSDIQSQRQFLNFNILGSSRQTPFSIDSNLFNEKKQMSEMKFPSEDSITFVFMGPNRQKTSILMEIIKRTLGQTSLNDVSIGEKSQKKSRNRGIQCKLMRSVSVDTAMIALSRFAKHQRPGLDITRTSSLDTLIPEEMQTIIEQGRLHGIHRENGCQCDLTEIEECPCQKIGFMKYKICTTITRDQSTETEKSFEMNDKSSMTSFMVDASCDALNEIDENLFEEYFPILPKMKLSSNESIQNESHWKQMKDMILGTSQYINQDVIDEEKLNKSKKSKKSVSWSDLSECDDLIEKKNSNDFDSNIDKFHDLFLNEKNSQSDYSAQTRRVRFTEPQRSYMNDICHVFYEKNEIVQTAANVTAFLKEAVQLLKNLNHLSQIYDLDDGIKRESDENDKIRNDKIWDSKFSKKKVETSVQTDYHEIGYKPKEISISAENSPIRRIRTSNSLIDKKTSLNLTWPRQRSNGTTTIGKPPTGLKFKPIRSPLSSRATSTHSSSDILKNEIDNSSTSTNWNISNLSTTFSNSYFGDSGCSRPSSSKSFYSENIKIDKFIENSGKYWNRSNSKSSFPRLSKETSDLEMELEDSCRRLEIAIESDRLREENSTMKLSSLNTEKYIPTSWYCDYDTRERFSNSNTESIINAKKSDSDYKNYKSEKTFIIGNDKTLGMKLGYIRKKPCKCYCHYRNTNKVYRSTLELEAQPALERHCHICCIPCETTEPERSNSTPALNSICDSEKCRLFYYGYCPCSPVKLQNVKSSPRAYMQHLLSLRRKIVKTTYDTEKNHQN